MEWEEEVAKSPLPPLAHKDSKALLVERPLLYVCDGDPWPPVCITYLLCNDLQLNKLI